MSKAKKQPETPPAQKTDALPVNIEDLSEAHVEELVRGSGISPAVIRSRGYKTITSRAGVNRLGYSSRQGGEGPWLFIPTFSPGADPSVPTGYQIKPTVPRTDARGKPVKYEIPAKSGAVMDIHPEQRERLADPDVALFITEGVKKADAAATHGLCCLALPGVWGWKAGSLPHEAWAGISLRKRDVVLAFDSDALTKVKVWAALDGLRDFLTKRGAKVKILTLPLLAGYTKVGLDDFLLQFPVGALDGYMAAKMPPRPEDEDKSFSPLVYEKPDANGEVQITPLANFDARITADILLDNDTGEFDRAMQIQAWLGEREFSFTLKAEEFEAMKWVIPEMGTDAILYAGNSTAQRAREVIQERSLGKELHRVYTHTGWRKISLRTDLDPEWMYLFAGGAIGASGVASGLAVELGEGFDLVSLPDVPADPRAKAEAVEASLRLVSGDDGVMPLQLYFSIWRAVLGDTRFAIWLVGQTGTGKSELAALCQQHWGSGLTPHHFLANWSSTENFLTEVAFQAKDMLLVVDDFKVVGGLKGRQKLNVAADRLIRSLGNSAGRGRMNRDRSLTHGRPPRGLIVATGEDQPEGESLRARMITLELAPSDTRFERLAMHQFAAARGDYAVAMSSYIQWLSPRLEEMRAEYVKIVNQLRATDLGKHRRTREAGASIVAAALIFLRFAQDIGVLDFKAADRLDDRLREEVRDGIALQDLVQMEERTTAVFRELLRIGLLEGRFHISGMPGVEAEGQWAGFMDDRGLFIDSAIARGIAVQVAKDHGFDFHVTPNRLHKSLAEDGFLQTHQTQRTYLTAIRYQNHTIRVLSLVPDFFRGDIDIDDDADNRPMEF